MVREHFKADGRLVTTNYVLTELIALFSSRSRVARPQMFMAIEALLASPRLEVVHVDATLHNAAWRLLKARPDKGWSLVDAVSFVLMQERGLAHALTTDHHFEQAGFVRLLAP